MVTTVAKHSVGDHFRDRAPEVESIYRAILEAAGKLGPVKQEPKKTSIHLVRKTAFAGVATRRSALILTLKSGTDIASPRVMRREQTSASRWHLEIRLESPRQVDAELRGWIRKAYALSG